jgi:hypothetical protein
MPDPTLTDLPLRVNRRTLRTLAALRKLLKCGDGPIVARAVAELAGRVLKQKAKARTT